MSQNPKAELITYLHENGKCESWQELAEKFGFKSSEAARCAWREYRRKSGTASTFTNTQEIVEELGEISEKITKFQEDLKSGKAEVCVDVSQEIKTLDELVEKCRIDLTKWEIVKWVQNFWNNRYQVKVWLEPKSLGSEEFFRNQFEEFLKGYKPKEKSRLLLDISDKPEGVLIINKQDSHYDKYDILGDNDVEARFNVVEKAIEAACDKAALSYALSNIVYVVGSDLFNSEYTSATTKGTPQKNTCSFHEAFEMICQHEVDIISRMLDRSTEVTVLYVPGNHDEYVGWHLIKWLSAYFRNETRVTFDVDFISRKYISTGKTLVMFNHGDAIKPEKLASIFPIECKDEWSHHDYYAIFTGDKHHTVAKDINGIMFYQLPSLSSAVSHWDDKNGHVCSDPEMVSFVIGEYGVSDIYKDVLYKYF